MKAKEIFGLAVRIIGLVFIYQGLAAVPNAITSICPVFPHFFWRNLFPSLWLVGWPLAVGYWLLSRAPRVMEFTYRDVNEVNAPLFRERSETTGKIV